MLMPNELKATSINGDLEFKHLKLYFENLK
jgi:hypothetical protein